jgi:ferredoxin
MATLITEECVNCGACLPRCPNNAIYEGGQVSELNGETRPPLAEDIYYIAPDKCTECVGFFDHEECAAVCPVDCCIPDPKIPETEDALIARARALHPDQKFITHFPSRFKVAAQLAPGERVDPRS